MAGAEMTLLELARRDEEDAAIVVRIRAALSIAEKEVANLQTQLAEVLAGMEKRGEDVAAARAKAMGKGQELPPSYEIGSAGAGADEEANF